MILNFDLGEGVGWLELDEQDKMLIVAAVGLGAQGPVGIVSVLSL